MLEELLVLIFFFFEDEAGNAVIVSDVRTLSEGVE